MTEILLELEGNTDTLGLEGGDGLLLESSTTGPPSGTLLLLGVGTILRMLLGLLKVIR